MYTILMVLADSRINTFPQVKITSICGIQIAIGFVPKKAVLIFTHLPMNNINLQFNAHESALRNFAIIFTKNIEDANDLVQDTFLKAIRYSNQFEDGTNLRGWLYTIMRNTFINDCRKQNKHRSIIQTVEDFLPNHLMKGAVVNKGDTHFIGEDINKALNMLSPDILLPFTKYFAGYKYHEIATELDIPLGTVKTRIHEARKHLKRTLKIYAKVN